MGHRFAQPRKSPGSIRFLFRRLSPRVKKSGGPSFSFRESLPLGPHLAAVIPGSLASSRCLACLSVLLYLVIIPGLWFLKWAFRNLVAAPQQSGSITVSSLWVGVLLLSLIPSSSTAQMKSGPTIPEQAPKLFSSTFRKSVDSLLETLDLEKPLQNLTPWVRGKLLKVKGENYEKYVEGQESANSEDKDEQFSRRGFNLSPGTGCLRARNFEGRMVASHFDLTDPAGGNFGRAKVHVPRPRSRRSTRN